MVYTQYTPQYITMLKFWNCYEYLFCFSAFIKETMCILYKHDQISNDYVKVYFAKYAHCTLSH